MWTKATLFFQCGQKREMKRKSDRCSVTLVNGVLPSIFLASRRSRRSWDAICVVSFFLFWKRRPEDSGPGCNTSGSAFWEGEHNGSLDFSIIMNVSQILNIIFLKCADATMYAPFLESVVRRHFPLANTSIHHYCRLYNWLCGAFLDAADLRRGRLLIADVLLALDLSVRRKRDLREL